MEDFDPEKAHLEIMNEGNIKFWSYSPKEYSNGGSSLSKSMPVFYNPVMVINRDITLIVYKTVQKIFKQNNPNDPYKICDIMAASGIRDIRLLKFLDSPLEITMNDLNPGALKLIEKNLALNSLSSGFKLVNFEAIYFLHHIRNQNQFFNVIDIDPFGTPNIFIESALRAVNIGGILAITATDTPVLFGVRSDACMRKYNTRSLKSSFLKELGLRILIYFCAIRAHPLLLSVEPLLSLSSEHFIRIFLKIHRGQEETLQNAQEFGYVLWCRNCDWRLTIGMDIRGHDFFCPDCHSKVEYGGPLWIGPIHNQKFVMECRDLLENCISSEIPTRKRLGKILDYISHEDEFPLGYYDIPYICDKMQIEVPSMKDLLSKIQESGFRVGRVHIDFDSIKTDIPLTQLKNILQNFSLKKV